jgi:hypothetical protein
MEEQNTFADLLRKHMEEMGWGPDQLENQSGVPKQTIVGWLAKGRTPRSGEDVLKIAARLGLKASEVNNLLLSARKPPLERLVTTYHDDPAKQQLLAPWIDEVNRRSEAEQAVTVASDLEASAEGQPPEAQPTTRRLPWLRFAIPGAVMVVVMIAALLIYTRNADAVPPQQAENPGSNANIPTIMPDETWTTVISETFNTGESNWATGTESDQYGEASRESADGQYRFVIEAATERGFTWGGGNFFDTPDTFYAAVDTHKVSGMRTSSCGLMVGARNNSNFHIFRVRDEEQRFSLAKVEDDTGWTALVPWQYSAEIATDAVNRMAILVDGSHFSLFVNDGLVQEWDDPAFGDGGVDVAVQAYTLDRVVCDFDNFELRVPPEG